ILDMQWIFHRLTALSGGSDVLEFDLAPDDNDSDRALDLDIFNETLLTKGASLRGL
ncbi:hypothetical protein ACJ72_06003, partial [Emergomyces africanus]